MIFRGKPLPIEIQPFTGTEYEQFLSELLPYARIQEIATFLQHIYLFTGEIIYYFLIIKASSIKIFL